MYGALSKGFKFKPRLKVWQDGQNNEFDQETFEARSYRHWLYCTKIKGKVVFNNYNYSNTTSNHQSNMRDLLKKLKIKIDIEVSSRSSLTRLDEILQDKYQTLFDKEVSLPRARKNADQMSNYIKQLKKDIVVLRKLGAKMSKEQIKQMKARTIANDLAELKRNREAAQERAALKKTMMPEMNDLTAIDLGFEKASELTSINLGAI